jgi:D-lactate dehydrogenase
MRIAFFDTHDFERPFFERANEAYGYEIHYFHPQLGAPTAPLSAGFDCVCSFVNDHLDAAALEIIKNNGVGLVALRSAGFNHVDLARAHELQLPVVRVPEYSPYAVAEHALALILTLNRKIHRAYQRVRELNFSLNGLVGFDLHGSTVGIIGTGKIGSVLIKIMHGLGCKILVFDIQKDPSLAEKYGVEFTDLDTLYRRADIISLHVPLTPKTFHLIDGEAIAKMKDGVFIINTGRGALIDSNALLDGLKARKVGGAGLDVYEEEEGVFFQDLSDKFLKDDVLARLLSFPNVIVTSHQAFLTREALGNIAETTLFNVSQFAKGETLSNQVILK